MVSLVLGAEFLQHLNSCVHAFLHSVIKLLVLPPKRFNDFSLVRVGLELLQYLLVSIAHDLLVTVDRDPPVILLQAPDPLPLAPDVPTVDLWLLILHQQEW